MADPKAEPSTPYGESGGETPSTTKNPATGEPSGPYGTDASKTSGGAGPVDKEADPQQQPT